MEILNKLHAINVCFSGDIGAPFLHPRKAALYQGNEIIDGLQYANVSQLNPSSA